jgi:hypothetical protein
VHLERSLLIPLLSAIVEVDLNGLDSHHAKHSLEYVEDVNSRADEGYDSETDKTAVESEALEPVDELFLASAYPLILHPLMVELTDDQVGNKEEESQYQQHKTADSSEPLIVVEIFALKVGHPVVLSHMEIIHKCIIFNKLLLNTKCANPTNASITEIASQPLLSIKKLKQILQ